jgi:hypothetical protein
MKTSRFVSMLMTALFILGTAYCSESEDPADTYIPDLAAAAWINVNDPTDQMFFFDIPAPAPATSTFNGNRNGTGASGSFTGSYNYSSITLTFTSGINNGRVFSGTVNGSVTPVIISLTSPASGGNSAISVQFRR